MKTIFSLTILLGTSFLHNLFAQCAGVTPPVDLGPDLVGCTGDVFLLDAGAGYEGYWWTTNTGGQTLSVNSSGTYGVTVFKLSNTNLVYNGNFQQGNTGFYTDYTVGTGGLYGQLSDPGTYAVDDMASDVHDYWSDCFDHTGVDFEFPLGKMLLVNGSTDINAKIWCQTISVSPWTSYEFSSWFASPDGDANVAQLQFSVNGVNFGPILSPQPIACSWSQFAENWYSNASTSAEICIVNMNPINGGNDVMIDDISFSPNCTQYDEVTITLYDAPVITANADETICDGETVTLTASSVDAGLTYTWEPGTIVAQSIDVSPSSSTSYSVSATNAGGCTSNVETVNVNVVSGPTLSIAGNLTICEGEQTTLTANSNVGGTTYTWSTAETTASINVTPATTSVYTLIGETPAGCTTQIDSTVTVLAPISVAITGNTDVCPGNSTTLTATSPDGGLTYLWSPNGETTASISVNSTDPGVYSVTIDNGACTATDNITVTTLANPVVTVDPLVDVCEGSTVDVTATADQSPVTFLWEGGAMTGATQTLDPAAATSYTVYAENANGCVSSTETVNLNVNALPTLSINGNLTICEGDQTTLTANSDIVGTTYTWSTAETTTSIDVSPITTTVYTLVAETPATCTSQIDSTVTVLAPISVAITGNTDVCSGTSTTLTATSSDGGLTYLWSPNGETTASISVNSTDPGVYSVTIDNGACTATDNITVTTLANPVVTVDPLVDVCEGSTVDVTATADQSPVTFLWEGGAMTGATQTLNPATATSYTVYAENADGCVSSTETVNLNVNALPTLSINGNLTICEGDQTTLTANSDIVGTTYTWSTAETTTSIDVSPITTTVYTLVAETPATCTSQIDSTVTVLAPISVAITGNTDVCSGTSTTLTATSPDGGLTYLWSPNGETTASISVNSTDPGVYSVTIDNGVCAAADNVTVTVLANPLVSVDPIIYVCEGSTVDVTVTSNQSPVTFYWNGGAMIGATQTLDPSITTNYTFYAENSDGCVSPTETVNLNVSPLPNLSITGNLTICEGDQTTLTANSDISGTTYTWSTTEITDVINVTPTSTTTYTLVGESPASCVAQVDEIVNVQAPISISIDGSTTVCTGENTTLTVNGNYTGMTFLWSPTNATTETITVNSANVGIYGVAANNGICSAAYTEITITEIEKPIVTVIDTVTICSGEIASLTAFSNLSAATFIWLPDGLTGQTQAFGPAETTTYYVYADNNGCASEQDSVVVVVNEACQLIVPNVFTPNEDGNNDKFFVIGSELIDDINCVIINRWGDVVASYDKATFEWDGKNLSGVDVPDGVYFYHITGRLLNGEEFDLQGFVELFR